MNELAIVAMAGTIRGSVAFALILTIEDEHNEDAVSVIKSTTLSMVFLTTIILGAFMPKFISICLGGSKNPPPHQEIDINQITNSLKESDLEEDQEEEEE